MKLFMTSEAKKVRAKVRTGEAETQPLPVEQNDCLIDDGIYISPVISSIKVKMKAKMNGKIEQLPLEEMGVIIND